MAREELRSRLGVPPGAFPSVVQGLVEDGRVEDRDGAVAAPGHRVDLHASDGPAAALLDLLGRRPFATPSPPAAVEQAGGSPEVVRALAQQGAIVRVSDDIAFTKAG